MWTSSGVRVFFFFFSSVDLFNGVFDVFVEMGVCYFSLLLGFGEGVFMICVIMIISGRIFDNCCLAVGFHVWRVFQVRVFAVEMLCLLRLLGMSIFGGFFPFPS